MSQTVAHNATDHGLTICMSQKYQRNLGEMFDRVTYGVDKFIAKVRDRKPMKTRRADSAANRACWAAFLRSCPFAGQPEGACARCELPNLLSLFMVILCALRGEISYLATWDQPEHEFRLLVSLCWLDFCIAIWCSIRRSACSVSVLPP